MLVQRATLFAALGIVIMFVLSSGIYKIAVNNSERSFFDENDPIVERTDWLSERMGSSKDPMLLAYLPSDKDVLSPFSLSQLRTIADEAQALPYVVETHSLFDDKKLISTERGNGEGKRLAYVSFFQGNDLFSEQGLSELKEDIRFTPTTMGRSIGRDFASSVITLQLELKNPLKDDELSREERITRLKLSVKELESLIQETEPNAKILLIGSTLFEYASTEVLREDVRTLFPIFVFIFIVALFLIYRSVLFAISALLLLLSTITATAGFAGWVGLPLSTLSVSGLLLVGTLAVADIVHIANAYFLVPQDIDRETALKKTLNKNLAPIIATTLTTGIGISALFFSPSKPIAILAIVILFGVWIALILVLAILPCILLKCHRSSTLLHALMSAYLLKASMFSRSNTLPTLIITAAISLMAFAGLTRMVIDDDLAGWFDKSTEFRQGMDLLEDNYLSLRTITVAVRVLDEDRDKILESSGSIDLGYHGKLQKNMNKATEGDWLSVLESQNRWRERIKQAKPHNGFNPDLNLLEENPPQASSKSLSESGFMTQLEPGVADWLVSYFDPGQTTTFALLDQVDVIKRTFETAERSGSREPSLQGIPYAFAKASAANFWGVMTGSLIALLLVSICMLLVFRSWSIAALSVLPNILPLLLIYGSWGWIDGKLNMAAIGVFAVAFGIIVDDTIHLIMAFKRNLSEGMNSSVAMNEAISQSGSAILITTILLCCGFFLLSGSDFNLTAQKAAMTGFAISMALVFDVLVLPVILLWKRKDSRSKHSI